MMTITERAAQEAVRILDEQAKTGAMVRIWIAGVGCTGFRYGLGIEERAPEPDDQVFTSGAARVVVDAGSMEHLAGAKLDWVDDPAGAGFMIDNPNPAPEASECSSEGCGGSCCGGDQSSENGG